ncbi:MAG: hypothetical protein OXF79_30315, partial [Chloroflexi bacterium]|nr:hypothetical protein [Chloroflexota bacterium]
MAIGFGKIFELAPQPDDGNGGVGQAGRVARQVANPSAATVFIAGEVGCVVQAVLDTPVISCQASPQTVSWLVFPVFRTWRVLSIRNACGCDSLMVKPARWREGMNFQAAVARFSTAKLLLAAAPLLSIIIAQADS